MTTTTPTTTATHTFTWKPPFTRGYDRVISKAGRVAHLVPVVDLTPDDTRQLGWRRKYRPGGPLCGQPISDPREAPSHAHRCGDCEFTAELIDAEIDDTAWCTFQGEGGAAIDALDLPIDRPWRIAVTVTAEPLDPEEATDATS